MQISKNSAQMNPAKIVLSKAKTEFVQMRQQGSIKVMEHIRQKLTMIFESQLKSNDGESIYQKMRYYQNVALNSEAFD